MMYLCQFEIFMFILSMKVITLAFFAQLSVTSVIHVTNQSTFAIQVNIIFIFDLDSKIDC